MSAPARVAISNLALQKIGASDRVTAPDQRSQAAEAIAVAWDQVRRGTIAGGEKAAPRWNFATRLALVPARALPPGTTLAGGWRAAFPLPDGCLRVIEPLSARTGRIGWRVAGGEVLADVAGPLELEYLVDVEEPTLWSPLFVETFAARLGFQIADRVTGDRGRKQDCWAEYEANLLAAAKVDAREDPPVETDESDWVLARGGFDPFDGARGLRWRW